MDWTKGKRLSDAIKALAENMTAEELEQLVNELEKEKARTNTENDA